MRVVQIGNFRPEHSTENHLRRALILNGHEVETIQEDWPGGAAFQMASDALNTADFVLWTRTGWDWGARHIEAMNNQRLMLRRARSMGTPVIGYHLDIWWGLKRQHQVFEEPFFEVDLLITADGGHDGEWEEAGINHVWFPPGVSEGECVVGTPREEYRSKIAFVGSNDGSYHPEHKHRHELVDWLRRNYRRDCRFWPRPSEPAVRGKELQDLYASVDVIVGDSCFAGTGLKNYWSDRIPETLGRGGFLLHPSVPGLSDSDMFPVEFLYKWKAFNWDELHDLIEDALLHPKDCAEMRIDGRDHVLRHHTYEVRMRQLVDLLNERNML